MLSTSNSNLLSDSETLFTFKIDDVVPKTELPPESNSETPEKAFRRHAGCKSEIEDFSHRDDSKTKIQYSNINGIAGAIHLAWINHYALKLSASDFILMIGQGLAKHMEVHAEDLRHEFVDFEGKEKLIVDRMDLIPGAKSDWSTVFGQFSDEIKKRVKTDLYDVMIDDTSVATKVTRIASEIVVMDAFKQYFEYVVRCICGIPKITLVGSNEDWEKLRTKVKKLKELNADNRLKLDWWLDHLVPLVDTLVDQATSRKIDQSFWKRIYQWQDEKVGYIPHQYISGWITVFNPYLRQKDSKLVQNSFHGHVDDEKGVHPSLLVDGISKVPFIWSLGEDKKLPMTFYGGYLGAQIHEDTTVEPVYFYAVAHDNTKVKQ